MFSFRLLSLYLKEGPGAPAESLYVLQFDTLHRFGEVNTVRHSDKLSGYVETRKLLKPPNLPDVGQRKNPDLEQNLSELDAVSFTPSVLTYLLQFFGSVPSSQILPLYCSRPPGGEHAEHTLLPVLTQPSAEPGLTGDEGSSAVWSGLLVLVELVLLPGFQPHTDLKTLLLLFVVFVCLILGRFQRFASELSVSQNLHTLRRKVLFVFWVSWRPS